MPFLVVAGSLRRGSRPRGCGSRRRGAARWTGRGARSPRHAPHTPPGSASGRPGAPHFAHSRTRRGGRVQTGSGGILSVRRPADQCGRVVDRGRQAGGQGEDDGLVVSPLGRTSPSPAEPAPRSRASERTGRGRYGRGRRAGWARGSGWTGSFWRLLRYVAAGERRPPAVVARRAGEPRSGDPARASESGQVFAAPAQVPCPLEVVEGRAESALAVRQRLGQRLYGDVGAAGETGRCTRRWRLRGAGGGRSRGAVRRELVRGGALAVTRVGHRVRGRVRGKGGSTKLGISHGIDSHSIL